ncbi:MAG: type IX secretion system PorP/SprF family membrane protein [Crocinitomix sp.]|jgi:type IX secretion system PorP/SprF family membrane protein
MLFPKTLALTVSLFTLSTFAQQDVIYQSEGQRSYWFNPASIGTYNLYSANSVAKTQWTSFDQAPLGLQVNGAIRCLAFGKKSGVPFATGTTGLSYRFEKIGTMRSHFVSVPINIQFKLNKTYLSVGISPGFHSLSFAGVWFPPTVEFDPAIPPIGISETKFNAGAGIQLYNYKFSLGLSSTHLFSERFEKLNYQARRHYYLHGSYKQRLTRSFSLEGISALRTDGTASSFTGMLYGVFSKKNEFSVGLGYRNGSSFLGALTARFDKIYVGYFLEYYQSSFVSNTFSHEIRIAFELYDGRLLPKFPSGNPAF